MKSLHIAVMLNHYIATFKPFWFAALTLAQVSVEAYTRLTSDQAKEVYRTLWILTQAAVWLSIFAAIQTLRAGQSCRRFYDAEWADDLNRLIRWLLTCPDTGIADTDNIGCVGCDRRALSQANHTAWPTASHTTVSHSHFQNTSALTAVTPDCVSEALPLLHRTTSTQTPADTSQNAPDAQTIGTGLSIRQLRQLAAQTHVKRYSRMTKNQLLAEIPRHLLQNALTA